MNLEHYFYSKGRKINLYKEKVRKELNSSPEEFYDKMIKNFNQFIIPILKPMGISRQDIVVYEKMPEVKKYIEKWLNNN